MNICHWCPQDLDELTDKEREKHEDRHCNNWWNHQTV